MDTTKAYLKTAGKTKIVFGNLEILNPEKVERVSIVSCGCKHTINGVKDVDIWIEDWSMPYCEVCGKSYLKIVFKE